MKLGRVEWAPLGIRRIVAEGGRCRFHYKKKTKVTCVRQDIRTISRHGRVFWGEQVALEVHLWSVCTGWWWFVVVVIFCDMTATSLLSVVWKHT
jgi:hypothetical protein